MSGERGGGRESILVGNYGVKYRFVGGTTDRPMSTMNSEVDDARVSAGADEAKAREAAKSVARHDADIAEIKASLLLLKWMVGFILAFVVALTWRAFQVADARSRHAPEIGAPASILTAAGPPEFSRWGGDCRAAGGGL